MSNDPVWFCETDAFHRAVAVLGELSLDQRLIVLQRTCHDDMLAAVNGDVPATQAKPKPILKLVSTNPEGVSENEPA